MNLKPAQLKASKKLQKRLQKYGIALLWGQVRSGKSRSFLHASQGYRTLVITTRSAVKGVLSEAKEIGIEVDATTYQSVHKLDPDDYDLIILDECHKYISPSQPKPSSTWKKVVPFTRGKFCIFSSGTPTAEGYGGLYWMLALSKWTPFPFKNFRSFFTMYGIESKIWNGEMNVASYKKTNVDMIKSAISHLVVTLKRKDVGHQYEVKFKYHSIQLNKQQQKLITTLDNDSIYQKKKCVVLADTGAKMLIKKHQIVGGVAVKCEDEQTLFLKKTPPKVKYIKDNFNVDKTIILARYIDEQKYLAKIFPHTGSVVKLSEGVDLSMYETLVIYSMSFSATNFEQVNARLMNVNRKTQMTTHILLSDIDNYVLKAVKNKENFTSSWYKKCQN